MTCGSNHKRPTDAANPVREGGPIDTLLARLRHGIAWRKLNAFAPLGRCLDIGSGAYPAFLLGLPAQEKYGLEQSVPGDMCELAASMHIRLTEFDLSRSVPLPFEDGFFDAVSMLAVIEHIAPSAAAPLLSEVHRILRPGGVLFVTTPAAWTDRLLRFLAVCRIISRREIEDHKDTFTQAKIRQYLQQAGFENFQSGTFECWMNLWVLARK